LWLYNYLSAIATPLYQLRVGFRGCWKNSRQLLNSANICNETFSRVVSFDFFFRLSFIFAKCSEQQQNEWKK